MESNEIESALQEIEHLQTVLGQQGNPTQSCQDELLPQIPSLEEILEWHEFKHKRECKYCRKVCHPLKASKELACF
ncbi:hypothetical protein DAPPUDRAFT_334508 [Daphnia pulex]|uniref:Uncharacterized protein n=1 Tax=Daphnia pulex TaxID=6669 RepID=E9HVQ7_DAPPU|nr:hypothetical protein DAPPUDRAFT_334508 [Daphnia pulex]|eukprot:EFX64175.1 hypothetical protein DAPPUDRAFT_334508 [Daphnia pulex]